MRLATTYLGFELASPLVPGASPLCDDVGIARRLEDAGAPMLTLRSLFQEQIADDRQYTEASAYLAEPVSFRLGPDEYLAKIVELKMAVRVPVVASLNCQAHGSWVNYAKQIEQAGADALELNIFNPAVRLDQTSQQIEQEHVAVVAAVRSAVKLPLALKLMSSYTSLPNFARQLVDAGAGALVVFNRLYHPEMDLEHLGLREEWKSSSPQELAPRLRALSALAGRVHCDLALTGGAHAAAEVLRATLAGANVVQMVTALLQHGPSHLRQVLRDIELWLDTHNFESLSQVRGSMSLLRTPTPMAGERRNLMSLLNH